MMDNSIQIPLDLPDVQILEVSKTEEPKNFLVEVFCLLQKAVKLMLNIQHIN